MQLNIDTIYYSAVEYRYYSAVERVCSDGAATATSIKNAEEPVLDYLDLDLDLDLGTDSASSEVERLRAKVAELSKAVSLLLKRVAALET
eukprot:COSAG05_NODE_1193_length_5569_cov_3.034552_7_plen_90_part_00